MALATPVLLYNGLNSALARPHALPCRTRPTPFGLGRKAQQVAPVRSAASDNSVSDNSPQPRAGGLAPDHIMLAILDANPYLNDGSKQAAAMAAGLAHANGSKMTVLCVDEKPLEEAAIRMTAINQLLQGGRRSTSCIVRVRQMHGRGCTEFEVLDQVAPVCSAAACGDVADARGADLLVLSGDAVHSKAVDANLLAEFVPCPIMMLP